MQNLTKKVYIGNSFPLNIKAPPSLPYPYYFCRRRPSP